MVSLGSPITMQVALMDPSEIWIVMSWCQDLSLRKFCKRFFLASFPSSKDVLCLHRGLGLCSRCHTYQVSDDMQT